MPSDAQRAFPEPRELSLWRKPPFSPANTGGRLQQPTKVPLGSRVPVTCRLRKSTFYFYFFKDLNLSLSLYRARKIDKHYSHVSDFQGAFCVTDFLVPSLVWRMLLIGSRQRSHLKSLLKVSPQFRAYQQSPS